MFFYQKNPVKVLCICLLVLCSFISCSVLLLPASQKDSVTISFQIPSFIASSPLANSESPVQTHARFVSPDTRSVVVSITGESMTEMSQTFDIPGGTAKETIVVNAVPAGLKRTITVTLKDSSGTVLASGSALVDIVDGANNSVSITPIPVGAIPITLGSESAPITSAWAGKTLVYSVALTSGDYLVYNYISGTDQSKIAIYNADGSPDSSVAAGTAPGTWTFSSAAAGSSFIAITLPAQYSGGATLQINTVTDNSTYTVVYNGNNNTAGSVPTDGNAYARGTSVTVLAQGSLAKTGSYFTGWNSSADGSGTAYIANTAFTMPANNLALYAQWTENPTITGISPTMGPVGTVITVTGTGFNSALAKDLVGFNSSGMAVPATANSTQLTFAVASGSTTGPVVLSVNGSAVISGPTFIIATEPTVFPATEQGITAIYSSPGHEAVCAAGVNVRGGCSNLNGNTNLEFDYNMIGTPVFLNPAGGSTPPADSVVSGTNTVTLTAPVNANEWAVIWLSTAYGTGASGIVSGFQLQFDGTTYSTISAAITAGLLSPFCIFSSETGTTGTAWSTWLNFYDGTPTTAAGSFSSEFILFKPIGTHTVTAVQFTSTLAYGNGYDGVVVAGYPGAVVSLTPLQ